MDDRQLREEIITLCLAGQATTASLLAWTLHRLGRHPEIQARVRDEIDTKLTDRQPTFEQFKSPQYTSQVINEVLRFYPPTWTVARNFGRRGADTTTERCHASDGAADGR